MVSARIAYVDLSKNPHVQGKPHRTGKSVRHLKCEELFQNNETFREDFRARLPLFRLLEDLYEVALEVNAFQRAELEDCGGTTNLTTSFVEMAEKDAGVWKEEMTWRNQKKIDRMRQKNRTNDVDSLYINVNATEFMSAVQTFVDIFAALPKNGTTTTKRTIP